jgi:hypothetical protein
MNVDQLTEKTYKLTQLWEGCRKDVHSFIAIIANDMVEYKEVADCFLLDIDKNIQSDIKIIVKDNIKDLIDFDVYVNKEQTKFVFKSRNDFTKELLLMVRKYNEVGMKK